MSKPQMNNDKSQTPEERKARNLLKPLEQVPPRDPNLAANTRAQFLIEADTLNSPVTIGAVRRLKEWLRPPGQIQFRFRTLTIAILLAVFVLGGAGATTYASQQALPGDSLYQVKLWLEDTRLAFSMDESADLELRLEFAQKRVDELRVVLSEGAKADYGVTSSNFEGHIETARVLLEDLGQPNDYESRLAEIVSAYNALHAGEDDEAPEQPGDDLEQTPEPDETDSPEAQAETPEAEDNGESEDEVDEIGTQDNDGEDPSSDNDDEEDHEEEDDEEEDGTEQPTDDGEDDDNEPDKTSEPDENDES